MRRFLAAANAAVLVLGTLALSFETEAAPLLAPALQPMTDAAAPVEKIQYFYGGRNYCFYPDGWQGPGWYWCGYAYTPGYGWGGGYGWRGWGGPPPGWRGGEWRGPGRPGRPGFNPGHPGGPGRPGGHPGGHGGGGHGGGGHGGGHH